MATIQRLADSCVIVTGPEGTTLVDPGALSYDSDLVDLESLGDIQRVLITHEHGDHVKPEFVRWLVDRGRDVSVHSNAAVAGLLESHDIEVLTDQTEGIDFEDVEHEPTPMGTSPPNRAFTVGGLLTHPGDSYQPSSTAPVLALPLLTPWGTMAQSFDFARRLGPAQAIPIHDFYLSDAGRQWAYGMAKRILADAGIEFLGLDWGESYTV